MKTKSKDFRAPAGEAINLKDWPTLVAPLCASKREYKNLLDEHVARLSSLQERLYASNQHAILVIFQAMDAAGKDGAIKHVMSGVNPQGCQVFSFSHPSATELKHDFLWRTTENLPERGRIGIFNRSYYEEVLIVRVHPEILRAEEPADDKSDDRAEGKHVWRDRFRSIVDLEQHLHRNGTRIVKIFLHMSKDEQRQCLLARIDDQHKNWKIKPADIEERNYWKPYRKAYEECMAETSTTEAPWYIVPADDKLCARLLVSHIILEALEALNMDYPKTTPEHRRDLLSMRKQLESE